MVKHFDSSVNRGPSPSPLGARRVIQGWDKGVQGMKVGGKRTFNYSFQYGVRRAQCWKRFDSSKL